MVVSMWPLKPEDSIRAVQITAIPSVHGAPAHIGLPKAIGISRLSLSDNGDAVESTTQAAGVLALRRDAPGG
jgi:uncharacterized protein YcsI (UPF0317 family)